MNQIDYFKEDYYRHYGTMKLSLVNVIKDRALTCSFALRVKGAFGVFLRYRVEHKYGVNFGLKRLAKIGHGLYLGHPFCIDVNSEALIGNNCNIGKCVTIGKENRGKRQGAPKVGDFVWIGAGAVIVGKVTIGNDVLIAPNAYVNFDVPPCSIVFGNPGKIVPRKNAVEGYINNPVNAEPLNEAI